MLTIKAEMGKDNKKGTLILEQLAESLALQNAKGFHL